MSKQSACQLVQDYHDQLLSDAAEQSFRKHLVDCPRCQAELSALEKTDTDLATAWNRVVVPEVAVQRIGGSWGSAWIGSPFWQVAAAVLVLVLGGVLVALWPLTSGEMARSRPASPPSVQPAPEPPRPLEFIGDQPMFAAVSFADDTIAEPVGSTPELTVYTVIPKTTYTQPDQEQ